MYKKIIIGSISLLILGVAYYAISPLFISTRVDEVAPVAKEAIVEADVVVETNDGPSTTYSTESESLQKEESSPVVVNAQVVGTSGHPASGTARVIETENGAVIRYENFKTINGPDLFVYLAKDLEAKEFVSLGDLKATEGNVNYNVPVGVDVSDYRYVMVWCKQFGVLFNYADLSVIN